MSNDTQVFPMMEDVFICGDASRTLLSRFQLGGLSTDYYLDGTTNLSVTEWTMRATFGIVGWPCMHAVYSFVRVDTRRIDGSCGARAIY